MQNRLAVVVVLAVIGCGARQHTPTEAQPPLIRQGHYTIRIKSATIEPRRPDGSPWHVSQPDNSAVVIGAAAGLVVGNPELGISVGGAFADKGGDPQAPVPFVRLKLAGATWTIAPAERSYAPVWNQPIEISTQTLRGDELVVIQVLDATDESLLGYGQLTLAELLGHLGQTLTNLNGSVPSLDIEAVLDQESWLDSVDVDKYGGGE